MVIQNFMQEMYEFIESRRGHFLIGIIVIANALLLGAMTFKALPEHVFETLHHLDEVFLGLYVMELFIKIYATRFDFFKKKWNLFDAFIVVFSLIHHQDFILILRAFRVLHLLEMLDASPKMKHILSGLGKAVSGIAHVLGILVLFFYIYSVIGVFLFQSYGVAGFDHIGASMKTMFQILTGDDWVRIMEATEKAASYAWIFFISFYVMVVFVILNLFIGVVVGALQSAEEEMFKSEEENNQSTLAAQLKRLESKVDSLKLLMTKLPKEK